MKEKIIEILENYTVPAFNAVSRNCYEYVVIDILKETNDNTAILNRIAPFLRRLIEPRLDNNETNDYVNGSSECKEALEAIKEWDSRDKKEEI